jgi:ABC-type tungstate transport system substrate-binding protein
LSIRLDSSSGDGCEASDAKEDARVGGRWSAVMRRRSPVRIGALQLVIAAAPAPTYVLNLGRFWPSLRAGFNLILSGGGINYEGFHSSFLYTTEHTVFLALYSTGIAMVIGLPLGCVLGLGRFRGRRALLAIGNALARVPPVVVGVFILLNTGSQSQNVYPSGASAGGRVFTGPLQGIIPVSLSTPAFHLSISIDTIAQSCLALPIIIALSATALQRVSSELLDQAQAFGASRWRRAVLALREARTAVLAAIIVAMGVTITAVGALYIVGVQANEVCSKHGPLCDRSDSLSLETLVGWQHSASPPAPPDQLALSIAYAELLIGVFFVMAATLTFLQQNRSSWIAGGQS